MHTPRGWSDRRSELDWRPDLLIREGERRRHPRLYEPFPMLIRGLAATGEAFHVHTVLDNVSAGGLYVRLQHRLVVGARVFAMIDLAPGKAPTVRQLHVAVRGRVVRTALHPDGRCGVGVQFVRHRFL